MCTLRRQEEVFILPPQSTHTGTTGWYAAIPLTTSPSTCTKTIYIASAKHWGTPWWWFLREPKHVGVFIVTLILFRVDATSNVHQLDFYKRILILKMHGTNITKKNFRHKINFIWYQLLNLLCLWIQSDAPYSHTKHINGCNVSGFFN
jgi:hypothetical protein